MTVEEGAVPTEEGGGWGSSSSSFLCPAKVRKRREREVSGVAFHVLAQRGER